MVFLLRYNCNYILLLFELLFCVNIYGMKSLGVEYLIFVFAVGFFNEVVKLLDLLVVD